MCPFSFSNEDIHSCNPSFHSIIFYGITNSKPPSGPLPKNSNGNLEEGVQMTCDAMMYYNLPDFTNSDIVCPLRTPKAPAIALCLYSKLLIYSFILGLFNNDLSYCDYIMSNDRLMNNELERMWKKAAIAK
jgi:hypothetical protein